MQPKTIKLRKPIKLDDGEEVAELTFRPLNGKLARKVKTDTDHSYALLLDVASLSTGESSAVIDLLDGEDLEEVMNVAKDFIPGGRLAGSEQSQR